MTTYGVSAASGSFFREDMSAWILGAMIGVKWAEYEAGIEIPPDAGRNVSRIFSVTSAQIEEWRIKNKNKKT